MGGIRCKIVEGQDLSVEGGVWSEVELLCGVYRAVTLI